MLLGPFIVSEHDTCFATCAGLGALRQQLPSQCFCKEKMNTVKTQLNVFLRGSHLFADFYFVWGAGGVLEPNPNEK
jgi:hypothetical protein